MTPTESSPQLPTLFNVPPAMLVDIDALLAEANELAEITDVPSADAARSLNARVARRIKDIGELRLAQTRQVDALKKRAMEYEKNVTKPLVEIGEAIDAALREYLQANELERLRREAQARELEKIQAEDEASLPEEERRTTAPIVAAEPQLDIASIPTRKIPRLVIVDETAIPREYLVIDEKKALGALVAGLAVAGCSLAYETVLVRR